MDADNASPAQICLKAAFVALMRGDMAERDRQVRRAQNIIAASIEPPTIYLARQPDGSHAPRVWLNS